MKVVFVATIKNYNLILINSFTANKIYDAYFCKSEKENKIADDFGYRWHFDNLLKKKCFITLSQHRKQKLEKLKSL